MDKHINTIFEEQELEDKKELEDNYINLIRREFEDADVILSMSNRKANLSYTETPYILDQVFVRRATEFSIRKHTASVIPYYHSHNFFEMIYVYEGICRQFIPASNEPSDGLQTFGDCREGQIPRPLGRFKSDAPLLAAGSLTDEDRKEIVLQKGEACFITPGTIHAILSNGQNDIILKMIIPAEMFREFWNNTFEIKDELMLRMESPDEFCIFPLSLNQGGSVRWLFTKLLYELYFGDIHKHVAIRNYLSLLFVTLIRNKADCTENRLLCQVEKQISNNLQNAQLKDIAGNMGYSPRHLERLLRENAGCTFSDVLQKIRMEKAAQLLTETNDTIELITEITGYQTEAGFHKGFRSFFGTTPNQYRKSHRKL